MKVTKLTFILLLIICHAGHAQDTAQSYPVMVQLFAQNKEPVAGASVRDLASNKTYLVDEKGTVRIFTTGNSIDLVVSHAQFENKRITQAKARQITVILQPRIKLLDETVVIGYGTTTKRKNTGSVSRISVEEIGKQPVGNPLAAMAGRMAGVQVTQSNGNAGAGFVIRIRGYNSLAQGNDPLFIIDGIPFPNNNIGIGTDNIGSSNGGQSPFASINPSDIISMEVLKDADATAIYGSRGANGVVLITTKKGRPGKTRLEGILSAGKGRITRKFEMLNSAEYIAMRKEALNNDGATPTHLNAYDLMLWDTTRNTNWQDYFLGGSAAYHDANLKLSGGNEHTQFLAGVGYHCESSVYPEDFYARRMNLHLNLNHSSANKKLLISSTIAYSNDNNVLPVTDLTNYINLSPVFPALLDSLNRLVWSEKGQTFFNPYSYLRQPTRTTTDNLRTSVTLSYKFLERFQFRTNMGYNFLQVNQLNTTPVAAQSPFDNPVGSAKFGNTTGRGLIIEPQINYEHAFDNCAFSILLGSTYQNEILRQHFINASGYQNDQLIEFAGAAPNVTASTTLNDYRYVALFSRFNFTWRDKWILNLTGRRDGSSRFGPANQFGNFGAAGAAWIFSQEKLFRDKWTWLSFGKLRTSYGTTGNDQIGNYQFLDNYGTVMPYQGQVGYVPSRIYNQDYAWEVNRKLEAAVELGAWNNRILFIANYFRNRTQNQLLSYRLPDQTGFGSVFMNFPAKVENTGWEFELDATVLRKRRFQWNSNFNISFTRNKLVEFKDLAASSYASTYEVGQSLNIVKLYEFTGVHPETGLYTFEDFNKDGFLSFDDQKIIKDLTPKFYGGWQNEFTLGKFSLSIFIQFVKQPGRHYYKLGTTAGIYSPGYMNVNHPHEVLDRWTKPDDVTAFQRFGASPPVRVASHNWGTFSDASIVDASFIRLKNLYFSYDVHEGLIKNLRMQQCRIFLQAQNLLTITSYFGLDPETNKGSMLDNGTGNPQLPPLRIIAAGVSFTF